MNMIEVKDLRKTYAGTPALDGITFSVERGSCVALLGPNGAGKTTAIEILEGFRKPTSGTAEVLGQTPADAGREWRDRVGVVLQSTFEASALTVSEELALARTSYSRPLSVGQTLEMVGLTRKARAKVAQLSGGQRRRLDVALGVIGQPELLFLDEPTTGFDPSARLDFEAMIGGLRDGGLTVVLTTHYLQEAAALADQIMVLNRGVIVAEGTAQDLGGPSAHLPRVVWTDAVSGERRSEVTATPTALIRRLSASGHEVLDLEVVRPDLEEVYLGLIDEGVAA